MPYSELLTITNMAAQQAVHVGAARLWQLLLRHCDAALQVLPVYKLIQSFYITFKVLPPGLPQSLFIRVSLCCCEVDQIFF